MWHDVRHEWVKRADISVIGVFRGVGMFGAARFALGGAFECPESKEHAGRKCRGRCVVFGTVNAFLANQQLSPLERRSLLPSCYFSPLALELRSLIVWYLHCPVGAFVTVHSQLYSLRWFSPPYLTPTLRVHL